jgi:CDP-diacylglycerol--serine O-phosphatidyltransferase
VSAPAPRGHARFGRAFPVVEHAGLANAVTLTGGVLGIAGVFLAARGAPSAAVTCCALTLPCDVLDGLIARRTGTSSAFGGQLDTLADANAFCILPAALSLALGLPAWTFAAAGFYAVTGLLRLARFAVVGTAGQGRDECFEGVPSAVAAGLFLAVASVSRFAPAPARAPLVVAAYLALGLAMISGVPFPKRGVVARSLWVIVPLAAAAMWIPPP